MIRAPRLPAGLGDGAVTALTVTALAAASVLAAAGPAHAATGEITAPAGGTVVTTAAAVEARATVSYSLVEPHDTVSLWIADPVAAADPHAAGGCEWQLQARTSAGDLGGTIALGAYPASCDASLAGRPGRNGDWVVSLREAAHDSRTVMVRVPPRAPRDVRATAGNDGEAVVTWTANDEPDTYAYVVLEGATRVAGGAAESLCDGSGCRAVVSYPAGGEHTLQVVAARRAAPDAPASSDLRTGSAASTVVVPAPGPSGAAGGGNATGASTPGSPGGAGAGPQGSRSPIGATAVGPSASVPPKAGGGRAGGPGFGQALSGKRGDALTTLFDRATKGGQPLPGLPPAGARAAQPVPTAGAAAPDEQGPDGTFRRTLDYGALTQRQRLLRGRDVPLASVADALGISPPAFWRCLAASALLLLGAAHIRRWSRSDEAWPTAANG